MIEMLFGRQNYVHAKKMLDATELKHRAIASNLANIETPGYQRVDIEKSFKSHLESAVRTKNVAEIYALEPKLEVDTKSTAVRPDGNNVALDKEMLALNRNSLQHEYLTQTISSSIKRLKTAITGKVQ